MGTLYIDRKGIHVKLDGNALAFYANSIREGMVPITPLKRVIVIGNITIETPALNRLADENITVIFLSGRRMRFHGMLHGRLHNNGLLRLKQYEKFLSTNPPVPSFPEQNHFGTGAKGTNHPNPPLAKGGEGGFETPFPLEFSTEIVKRKVDAQLNLLNEALPQRLDLRFPLTTAIKTLERIQGSLTESNFKLSTLNFKLLEGSLDSLRGLEGSAAAAYFSAYTKLFPESLNFKNRNRRPPEDPVNAMLSLCYTMLHYEIVREIEVIGLDPTIGFYHQFEYGRESLACDLVELYRPEVDRFVWTIFRERQFTARDFSCESNTSNPSLEKGGEGGFVTVRHGCYLKKGGRQRFYPLYEEWAQLMRPLFVEEVRGLAKRIMDEEEVSNGQDTVFK